MGLQDKLNPRDNIKVRMWESVENKIMFGYKNVFMFNVSGYPLKGPDSYVVVVGNICVKCLGFLI